MIESNMKKGKDAVLKTEFSNVRSQHWLETVDSLRKNLGAPDNKALFPPHFLKSTFPKIGGEVFVVNCDGKISAVAFLFPKRGRGKKYTARLHVAKDVEGILEKERFITMLAKVGVDNQPYCSDESHSFKGTHKWINGFDFGKPSQHEAGHIRDLQKMIWGSSEDYLYPSDIHSVDFDLATSLVVRDKEQVIGFLFGFYKHGKQLPSSMADKYKSFLTVESQLMGILPSNRGQGLGFQLKRCQAKRALEEGIDIVNWTVDPLQFSNAVLNFGKLRAIAFDYYPNYYAFRNELNQVAASRFGITWCVSSQRAKKVIFREKPARAVIHKPQELKDLVKVNNGFEELNFKSDGASWIAIEVPLDWVGLQKQNLEEAIKWREATDKLFNYYLGSEGKGYAISDVGIEKKGNKTKHYLLGRKINNIDGL